MKRGFTLLLASMVLAAALTACGGGNDSAQNGTGNQNDSALTGDIGMQGGENGANSGGDMQGGNNSPNNGGAGMQGGDNSPNNGGSLLDDAGEAIGDGVQNAQNALDKAADGSTNQAGGVSYGQMLRNGRVHDKDGDLTDMENSATPGSTF